MWKQMDLENKDLYEYSRLLEEEVEEGKKTVEKQVALLAHTQHQLDDERLMVSVMAGV